MSLGRSSQFKDSDIEVDLLKKPDPEKSLKSYQFYVNLAIIQSGIVQDLQSSSASREPHDIETILSLLLQKMNGIWHKMRKVSFQCT